MAPNPRIRAALMTMKTLGIKEDQVKPVLKRLLKLYDKKMDLIEEDGYRVLIDAIFEEEENRVEEKKRKRSTDEEDMEEDTHTHELERKKMRSRNHECDAGHSSTQRQMEVQESLKNKGKQPLSSNVGIYSRDQGIRSWSSGIVIRDNTSYLETLHKDEPCSDEVPLNEPPIAMIPPDFSVMKDSSLGNKNFGGSGADMSLVPYHVGSTNGIASLENGNYHELVKFTNDSSTGLEVASLPLGEDAPGIGCSRSQFSGPCALDGSSDTQSYNDAIASQSLRSQSMNEGQGNSTEGRCNSTLANGAEIAHGKALEYPGNYHLARSVVEHPLTSHMRCFKNGSDISKGEESRMISWVNDIDNQCPPFFYYVPESVIFEGANAKFTLSGIGEENCCSNCSGDCLASVPCACAKENGGEFVFTVRGLVKEAFLQKCITINRDPQKRHNYYCQVCPFGRSKHHEVIESCKGHQKRSFIKECWRKCGCNKSCGNRVVQRGITCNLQVYMTSEGKGWGLQTLDELPKGAFVCEYAGEILTIRELNKRKMQADNGTKYTHEVLLDSEWGALSVKDNEALCLDATVYGNIARFINHRCYDANLIEIPIEVESAKRHYYRVALFTTRKVLALEELTWDYGIDFDDHSHNARSFQCLCGSKFCRQTKRPRVRAR